MVAGKRNQRYLQVVQSEPTRNGLAPGAAVIGLQRLETDACDALIKRCHKVRLGRAISMAESWDGMTVDQKLVWIRDELARFGKIGDANAGSLESKLSTINGRFAAIEAALGEMQKELVRSRRKE